MHRQTLVSYCEQDDAFAQASQKDSQAWCSNHWRCEPAVSRSDRCLGFPETGGRFATDQGEAGQEVSQPTQYRYTNTIP